VCRGDKRKWSWEFPSVELLSNPLGPNVALLSAEQLNVLMALQGLIGFNEKQMLG
jgi:hypothetical protein